MPVQQVQSVSTSLNHAMSASPDPFLHEVSSTLCDQTFAHDMQNAVQILSQA